LNQIILILILFFPKISLISISGYSQGVRIEDIICLAIIVSFFLNKTNFIVSFKFIFFLIYLILVMIIGQINEVQQEWIIVARLVEYFVIGSYILNCKIEIKSTVTILLYFIYLNLLIAILQVNGYLGAFPSFGYLNAGHGWLDRAYGLSGGPWELGLMTIIAFFAILESKRIKSLEIVFLVPATFYILILTGTRANTISFIIGMMFFLIAKSIKLSLKKSALLIVKILIVTFAFIVTFYSYSKIDVDRYITIIEIYKYMLSPSIDKFHFLINSDASLYNRFVDWIEAYRIWSNNIFNIFFGIGWYKLYLESFDLRLIFGFGIIGGLICIHLLYKLNSFYMFLILIIAGTTLDIFVSFKIYFVFLLYQLIVKNSSPKHNAVSATTKSI